MTCFGLCRPNIWCAPSVLSRVAERRTGGHRPRVNRSQVTEEVEQFERRWTGVKQGEGSSEINPCASKLPCRPHLKANCVSHLNKDTPSPKFQMTIRDEMAWFKEQFAGEIPPALAGTPLSFDLICAIAFQESGDLW